MSVNMPEIEDMLRNNPLSLLAIKDEQVIDALNNLIPYSTGFDIECHQDPETYDVKNFKAIPDIMNVGNDIWEQRYRIPNGIRGIICLYNLSIQLKINSLLNPESSIHYHVDCTDCFKPISEIIRQEENVKFILSELDTWICEDEDRDKVSSRGMGSWFKLNDMQTVEFRLGEMTFEYRWMLKRVIHCNKMVKKFKDQIPNLKPPVFLKPDLNKLLSYEKAVFLRMKGSNRKDALLKKYELLQDKEKEQDQTNLLSDLPFQVRNRVHKIYDDEQDRE